MTEISISIENKYFGDKHKVITLKQKFLGIILCFFYTFKMAMVIASLCINASDYTCTLTDQTLFFSNLYGHTPRGPRGVKNSDFFSQIILLRSWPFGSQNMKKRVFRFELFSVHLPLWYLNLFIYIAIIYIVDELSVRILFKIWAKLFCW